MTNLPLEIPAGFLKVDSPNAGRGRFTDGDKIRFVKGKPEKWLGWARLIDDTVVGMARGAVAWTNAYGNTNIAIGTHLKLYVVTGNDTLTDITPIRASGTLGANPFTMVSGSSVVTVADTAHGADDGDFVTFGGASAACGITISGAYQLTYVDANTYTITHSSAATSSGTGGGASVTYAYQINIGVADSVVGLGWGAGTWGGGTWSTPRSDGITVDLRHWSVCEYGNDLLSSPSGGGLYLWEEETDTKAEIVTNAPTAMRAMFVTGERFVFALGTSTPMTIEWPDQDDITDWTPSASNNANARTLQVGSKIINGTPLVDNVNLVWTDTGLYVFQYTGSEFVYDSRLAGDNCGLAAPKAWTRVGGVAYWMSAQRFKMYSGGVQDIPNAEDVQAWVFSDMDAGQIAKTWCVYDKFNNQVRWGYCSQGETEPNRYVDVDLDDFSWTTGTLDRTTGCLFRPSDASMIMVDHGGAIYSHNETLNADGAALEAYLTFGLYALARGEQVADVFGIIPDCQRQTGALTFEVFTKNRPNSASNFDEETATLDEGAEIADIRVTGRHFSMTVRSNEVDGDFRLGVVNLEVQPAGERR